MGSLVVVSGLRPDLRMVRLKADATIVASSLQNFNTDPTTSR